MALRVARQVGVVQDHGLADGGGLALSAHRTIVDRDGGASKLSHENHDDADEHCAANVPSTQSSRSRLPAKNDWLDVSRLLKWLSWPLPFADDQPGYENSKTTHGRLSEAAVQPTARR